MSDHLNIIHTFTLPIVGLWFKPPSMKLVKVLPLNTNLELIHEPHNPVDSNAVAVWLDIKDLHLDNLYSNTILSRDIEDAFNSGSWLEKARADSKVTIQADNFHEFKSLAYFQLGYISAENAKLLINRRDWKGSARGQLKWPTIQQKRVQANVHFSL